MSVYTVQGNPVMHNGQFLSPGGPNDLPPYNAGDANKVLKVNASGLDIGWADDEDTQYTAGSGISITGDEISVDTSVVATQSDLSSKQDTLTAGSNITIQNNVISASAAPQVQANWNESNSSSVSYIQNKPTEKALIAGSGITITETAQGIVISLA